MKRNGFLAGLVFWVGLSACSSGPSGSDRVTEIPLDTPFAAASLVRFPPDASASGSGRSGIEFEHMQLDFGQVFEGAQVERAYPFRNSGDAPLLIRDVRSSCGCTVPRWPQEAIPPGGTDTIFVRFNTKGRFGQQQKSITLTTNADPEEYRLLLQGRVWETQQEH